MQISVHDYSNETYTYPTAAAVTPWMHAWTAQQLVSAAEVTQTGGTYV